MLPIVRRASTPALVVALLLSPLPAAAQGPTVPNVRLYETMEGMTLGGSGNVIRRASAALTGGADAGSVLCPVSLGVGVCTVNVTASSTARIDTGKGTVTGQFSVTVPCPPFCNAGDNPVDAPEITVLSGNLRADIDLSPTSLEGQPLPPGVPIATLTGTLQGSATPNGPLGRLVIRGAFSGIFRLPFVLVPGSPVPPSFYVDDPFAWPNPPLCCREVRYPEEYLLGYPMVLLELALREQ
jgi:hypothetical protein